MKIDQEPVPPGEPPRKPAVTYSAAGGWLRREDEALSRLGAGPARERAIGLDGEIARPPAAAPAQSRPERRSALDIGAGEAAGEVLEDQAIEMTADALGIPADPFTMLSMWFKVMDMAAPAPKPVRKEEGEDITYGLR